MTFVSGQPAFPDELNALAALTEWGDYNPVLTHLTQGNGIIEAHYQEFGGLIHCYFSFKFGSSGSAVGTDPEFSPPVPIHSIYPQFFQLAQAALIDASAGPVINRGGLDVVDSTTVRIIQFSGNAPASITSTSPWTWAVNDVMAVEYWYRPA